VSLDADARVDRRRLKRRLTLWRVFAVVLAIAAVLLVIDRERPVFEPRHIARLAVSGIITEDPDREEALKDAAADPAVAALIVRIDSPGGTVVGGESLYRELRAVSARKPVAVVMGEMATSAAYMTALAGDRIFAREGSITGSIGVILQTANVNGLLDKLGITTEALKSAPLKAVPSPVEPLTPEAREATMAVIHDVFDMFKGMVQERRAMTPDQVASLSDGRVFTGRQAVKNGLIDEIGGEPEAINWLGTAFGVNTALPVRDLDTGEERRLLRDVLGGWAGKALFSERLTLDGLVSLWHPDLR
jgi:protease-4